MRTTLQKKHVASGVPGTHYLAATNSISMNFQKLLVSFCCLILGGLGVVSAQTQLGQNLNAEASGDRYGNAVDLSTDGRTAVVAGFFNDGAGQSAGHVRVFDFDGNNWVQFGNDLDGTAATDFFGTNVALSADGTIVAVGASGNDAGGQDAGLVQVFSRQAGDWERLGNTITGDTLGGLTGNSLALSADGSLLAVGSFGYRSSRGQVRVYALTDGAWAPIGARIRGAFSGQDLGVSLDLSADGSILAVGASALNSPEAGTVQLFERTDVGYQALGQTLSGSGTAAFGESVSLSADGTIVAVGVPYQGVNRGEARVFRLEDEAWRPLGNVPGGLEDDDFFGFRVDLSGAGDRLAISAPRANVGGMNSGTTSIFELDGNSWITQGEQITGFAFSNSGLDMGLSRNGTTLIIGAEFLADDETQGGQAKVYDLSALTSINLVETTGTHLRVFPNPVASTEVVTVLVPAEFRNGQVELIDAAGRVLRQQPVTAGSLRTEGLRPGMFVVRVRTVDRVLQQTLIIR